MNTQPGSPVHTAADQAEWQVSPHYPDDLRRTCRWKSLIGSGANWVGAIPQKDVIMGILELDAGGYYPAHAHPAPEIYFVTGGEAEWTVGEETFTARPGVAIYHAAHTPHRMVNKGPETLRAIWFWWAPDGSAEVLRGEVYFTEAAPAR
jgi:quercetin dioxygenase-like cupin family protein